eukprot:260677-Amorphochlora_amoeboformis.AAC.1
MCAFPPTHNPLQSCNCLFFPLFLPLSYETTEITYPIRIHTYIRVYNNESHTQAKKYRFEAEWLSEPEEEGTGGGAGIGITTPEDYASEGKEFPKGLTGGV